MCLRCKDLKLLLTLGPVTFVSEILVVHNMFHDHVRTPMLGTGCWVAFFNRNYGGSVLMNDAVHCFVFTIFFLHSLTKLSCLFACSSPIPFRSTWEIPVIGTASPFVYDSIPWRWLWASGWDRALIRNGIAHLFCMPWMVLQCLFMFVFMDLDIYIYIQTYVYVYIYIAISDQYA